MHRHPPRSTLPTTPFPTRRSSDLTARFIFRSQGGNNLLQARPFQYFGQTMESQVNPVVRDAALRKIICPNTFGAIAGANHRFAGARLLARGTLPFQFIKTRAESLQSLGLVLLLRLFLLLADHKT